MSIAFLPYDMRAASGTSHRLRNLVWSIVHHTAHLVILFRIGQSVAAVPLVGRFLRFLVEYVIRIVFASDLSCRAQIGPGMVIMHGHDIVIGADVRIGKNCKIFNGVTLGSKDTSRSSAGNQPSLGDDVVLSTGAKILGALTLGSNVLVGANSVVLKSYCDDVVIAGVPARILGQRPRGNELRDSSEVGEDDDG